MFWNLKDFKIPTVFNSEIPYGELQINNWAHANKIDILCLPKEKDWIVENKKADQKQCIWNRRKKNSQSTDQFIIDNKINLILLKTDKN
jgi:hypothetical protein